MSQPTTTPSTPPPSQQYQQNRPNYNDVQPETISSMLGAAKINPAALHPMAGLGKGVDYLNLDDAVAASVSRQKKGRGWSDEMSYGTGTAYFLGLTTGGAWGIYEGLKTADNSNMKLRINGMLNSCTRRGPFLGNNMGMITMMYCGANSMIRAARGKNDSINNILAAGAAGALFKSTAGLRASGVAGGLCAGLVGLWALGREASERLPSLLGSRAMT